MPKGFPVSQVSMAVSRASAQSGAEEFSVGAFGRAN